MRVRGIKDFKDSLIKSACSYKYPTTDKWLIRWLNWIKISLVWINYKGWMTTGDDLSYSNFQYLWI